MPVVVSGSSATLTPTNIVIKRLVILIPTYTPRLTADEQISVSRLLSLCPDRDIRVVCPADMPPLEHFESLPREEFPARYFEGIAGYNRLMMSEEFYARFEEYEYLLICQTDAFLFRDDLSSWCDRGYSYVGAPWLVKRKYRGLGRILLYLRALPKRLLGRPFLPLDLGGKVGNGGFSLRRVADFLSVCRSEQDEIEYWLLRSQTIREYNEDCYWATRPGWKYPSAQEALEFAFDLSPEEAFIQNGNRLPMAAHGWNKPRYKAYWQPFITQFIRK